MGYPLSILDDGRVIAVWYELGESGFGFVEGRLPVWANELDTKLGWGDPSLLTDAGIFPNLNALAAPNLVSTSEDERSKNKGRVRAVSHAT